MVVVVKLLVQAQEENSLSGLCLSGLCVGTTKNLVPPLHLKCCIPFHQQQGGFCHVALSNLLIHIDLDILYLSVLARRAQHCNFLPFIPLSPLLTFLAPKF